MKKKNQVVKRRGLAEKYDSKKVYASVYSAALNCEYGERESEKLASEVCKKIDAWIKDKGVVHSSEIREEVIELLERLSDKGVVLMYRHHLDLS